MSPGWHSRCGRVQSQGSGSAHRGPCSNEATLRFGCFTCSLVLWACQSVPVSSNPASATTPASVETGPSPTSHAADG